MLWDPVSFQTPPLSRTWALNGMSSVAQNGTTEASTSVDILHFQIFIYFLYPKYHKYTAYVFNLISLCRERQGPFLYLEQSTAQHGLQCM